MTRSWADGKIGHNELDRQKKAKWSVYDKCDICGALPRMPCRDWGFGKRFAMDNPHPTRKKLEE